MRVVTADEIDAVVTYPLLVEVLREAFKQDFTVPPRHHHVLPAQDGGENFLLLMPAWNSAHIGVKTVSVFPGNPARGRRGVQAGYLLLDAATGAPCTVIDGTRLTLWRTASASALAASYLARRDAARMLIVGAGALAPFLVRAHAAMRPIERIAIWNRTGQKAEALAQALRRQGLNAAAMDDLGEACGDADIVSCATGATTPLLKGAWLKPGTHVDLVGAFTPRHREADDALLRKASLFVDTRSGALKEAGDIVQAMAAGVIDAGDIRADLFELARGKHPGRESDEEITVFKSVGTALEDLAVAQYIYDRLSR